MDYIKNGPSPASEGPPLAGGWEGSGHSGGASKEQELFAKWNSYSAKPVSYFEKPNGLYGEIADLIYRNSQRPIDGIALASATALCAGIVGRAYNTTTLTGLNQDIQVVGKSGIGKDVTASGPDFIVSQVAAKTSAKNIYDFIGAGDFSSYAGGYQALCGPSLSIVCIIGENGKKFAELKLGKNPHLVSANRFQLQAFMKSGAGQVFRPNSYADKERKLPALSRASLTMLADSTPGIYNDLSDDLFVDGTIPRKLWFDIPDDRPPRNPALLTEIPDAIAQAIANVAAHCRANQDNMLPPTIVGFNPGDNSELIQNSFNDWCDDKIRASQNESERALWSRAHIKALRLAALQAVWANYLWPQITEKWMLWAIDIVLKQTLWLALKTENGEIGEQAGNVSKQQQLVLWAMTDFLLNHENLQGYFPHGLSWEYVKGFVVPYAHISQRLNKYAAFKNDRRGAIPALQSAIKELLSMDFIRELPPQQMLALFRTKGRGFQIEDIPAVHRAAKYKMDAS